MATGLVPGDGLPRAAALCPAYLPLLSALVTKSLVYRPEQGRYDLHQLLRQYAAIHLEADPQICAATQARCCAFYLDLVEAAEPELRGPLQLEWLDRLKQDHANLRAVLEWSLDDEGMTPDGLREPALRLAGALRWFWHNGTHYFFSQGSSASRRPSPIR